MVRQLTWLPGMAISISDRLHVTNTSVGERGHRETDMLLTVRRPETYGPFLRGDSLNILPMCKVQALHEMTHRAAATLYTLRIAGFVRVSNTTCK